MSPLRIFGKWYLVKDTTIPRDYPPGACRQLVRNRLVEGELKRDLAAADRELFIRKWQDPFIVDVRGPSDATNRLLIDGREHS